MALFWCWRLCCQREGEPAEGVVRIQSLLRNSGRRSNKTRDEVLFQKRFSQDFSRELTPAFPTAELFGGRLLAVLCFDKKDTLTCPDRNCGSERYECHLTEVFMERVFCLSNCQTAPEASNLMLVMCRKVLFPDY